MGLFLNIQLRWWLSPGKHTGHIITCMFNVLVFLWLPIFYCTESCPFSNKFSTMLCLHFICSVSVVSVCCSLSCLLILAQKEMGFTVMEGNLERHVYGCNHSVYYIILQKSSSSNSKSRDGLPLPSNVVEPSYLRAHVRATLSDARLLVNWGFFLI